MIHQIDREFNTLFKYVTNSGQLLKIKWTQAYSGEIDWWTQASTSGQSCLR